MANRVLKLLAFDSWTGGLPHYERLVDALNKVNIELTLVHIGSWNSEDENDRNYISKGIKVRDVSCYRNFSLADIIEFEKPDCAILLSTHTFVHRAFIRYCKYLRVPTIHLVHGIFATLCTEESGSHYSYSLLGYGKFVFERIFKMTFKVIPCYFRCLLKTGFAYDELYFFVRDCFALLTGADYKAAPDTITDKLLLYTEADKEFAINHWGFNSNQIKIVGNPDYLRFGLLDHHINSVNKCNYQSKTVVYIDTSLVLRGAVFDNVEEWIGLLKQIKSNIESNNLKFKIKLHPNFYETDIPAKLSRIGFSIISEKDYIDELLNCFFVLTEASTAGLIPCFLGLPVYHSQIGKLISHKFGKILTSYPRSKSVKSFEDLDNACKTVSKDYEIPVSNWIKNNLGPLPLSSMPDRVVANITDLLASVSK